jgi:hypothetical protein
MIRTGQTQQRRLDYASAGRWRGGHAREVRDALGDPQARGERAVMQGGVPQHTGRGHAALGAHVDLARELFASGNPLDVGAGDGVGREVEPRTPGGGQTPGGRP